MPKGVKGFSACSPLAGIAAILKQAKIITKFLMTGLVTKWSTNGHKCTSHSISLLMVSDNLKHFLFTVSSLIWYVICAGFLTACSTPTPNGANQTMSIVKPVPDKRIQELLSLAEYAFDRNRLTTPIDDNAYLWYLQVLAIDNNNANANHGIGDLVEKYLSWALDNSDTENFERAFDYIAKARSIDETHPNIAVVEAHVKSKTAVRVARFQIDKLQLRNKSARLKSQLREIAEEINRLDASVIIRAPSDSLGRWIYHQLNGLTRHRLSANFEISNSPQVTLNYY